MSSTALMRYRPAERALSRVFRTRLADTGKRHNSVALSTTLSMYLCFKGFYHVNLFWNFHLAANPLMLAAARQQRVVSEVVFGMLLQSPRLLASTPPTHQTYAMDMTLQGVSSFGKKISGPPVRPATLMNQSHILQSTYMLSV